MSLIDTIQIYSTQKAIHPTPPKRIRCAVEVFSPEIFPVFTALVVEPLLEVGDVALEVSLLQGRPHLLVRVLTRRVHVKPQGTREQYWILRMHEEIDNIFVGSGKK